MSGTATPMEPTSSGNVANETVNKNTVTGNGKATNEASVSSEPVYRFYLSPPPTANSIGTQVPMGSGPQAQTTEQQQAMFQTPMGLVPFNPYMPLSPGLAGVSAFPHPAYYAPTQQSLYYPPAFGMPAMSVQPRASTVSSGSQPENRDEDRAIRTVDNSGAMGNFGTDQDGQYIEIKFPTFGQAQMQQMLQQLQLNPRSTAPAMQIPPPSVQQPHSNAQAAASPPPVTAGPPAKSNGVQMVDPLAPQSNISIYDAERFADAHMEDIVFERKAFFWKIDNWDKLERRATGEIFRCGGFTWRILLRPFGSSHKGVLSLFLECLGMPDNAEEDWRCICRFVLAIANPIDPSHNTHGAAYHCFHRNNPNWGFTRFMKLADLRTAPAPGVRPYIEDGACTIAAYLHVVKDPSQ
ncbi:ubiquitin-specific protease ubp15 [Coemansia sp. RSA 1365]|nr:ubiquitin-specific protease ubp15 [Coemansia sp. RSA 1365]